MEQPNPATVRRTAELLATLEPDAAGAAIEMVMAAISTSLRRDGEQPETAERFAVRFGRAVLDLLRQMARPPGATVH